MVALCTYVWVDATIKWNSKQVLLQQSNMPSCRMYKIAFLSFYRCYLVGEKSLPPAILTCVTWIRWNERNRGIKIQTVMESSKAPLKTSQAKSARRGPPEGWHKVLPSQQDFLTCFKITYTKSQKVIKNQKKFPLRHVTKTLIQSHTLNQLQH